MSMENPVKRSGPAKEHPHKGRGSTPAPKKGTPKPHGDMSMKSHNPLYHPGNKSIGK